LEYRGAVGAVENLEGLFIGKVESVGVEFFALGFFTKVTAWP
jgi:hypothetical protein